MDASAALEKISYADAQLGPNEHPPKLDRSYELARLHRRSNPSVQTGPGGLGRRVHRQETTRGFGALAIEYEITSEFGLKP